jgi:hypothetical protein
LGHTPASMMPTNSLSMVPMSCSHKLESTILIDRHE